MTVIAFKDGVMAADTLAQDGQTRWHVSKLTRLPDGGVAGFCGTTSAGYAAIQWLATGGSDQGHEEKKLLPDISGACVLIAKADGSLWLLEDRFPAWPLIDKFSALGCGQQACLTALGLGLSAVDAVRQVARHDMCVGDPVQSMRVQPTIEYEPVKTHPKRTPKPVKKRK